MKDIDIVAEQEFEHDGYYISVCTGYTVVGSSDVHTARACAYKTQADLNDETVSPIISHTLTASSDPLNVVVERVCQKVGSDLDERNNDEEDMKSSLETGILAIFPVDEQLLTV